MQQFRFALLTMPMVLALASCQSSPNEKSSGAQQSISSELQRLYMDCSAAPPQSAQQQSIIRQMADKASSGKELLLVMRAETGVFPANASPGAGRAQREIHSIVAAKMIKAASFDELTDYVVHYPVNKEDARPVVERMFDLASAQSDPAMWQQVARAARVMKVSDLAGQAQAKRETLPRQ